MEEVDLGVGNIQEKTKNKKTAIIAVVIAIVIIVAIIAVIAGSASSENSSEPFQLSNVEMTKEYSEYLGWDSEITGMLKNVSGRNYDYISIEFGIYDANGSKIGSAYDNLSGLAKGEVWSFKATSYFSDAEPVSYKLVEITKW